MPDTRTDADTAALREAMRGDAVPDDLPEGDFAAPPTECSAEGCNSGPWKGDPSGEWCYFHDPSYAASKCRQLAQRLSNAERGNKDPNFALAIEDIDLTSFEGQLEFLSALMASLVESKQTTQQANVLRQIVKDCRDLRDKILDERDLEARLKKALDQVAALREDRGG